jgi:hypothetical protein
VQVRIQAPVRATERPESVAAACTAWWPDAEVQVMADEVRAVAAALDAFRARVWEMHIIDAVRSRLLGGAAGATLSFRLDKQAALAGRISFPATPHALGDVAVEVHLEDADPWPDAEALCWWLCPETRDGQIVGPTR